jgi:2-oxoglutarate ferredoxin oxidoreductase subunit gamma
LVCLTQEAYHKFSSTIRPGGLLLTESHFVKQERRVEARQIGLEMYKAVMERIGKPMVLNICMLGAVIGLTQIVRTESIVKVLETKIPPGFLEINRKALDLGLELAEASGAKRG